MTGRHMTRRMLLALGAAGLLTAAAAGSHAQDAPRAQATRTVVLAGGCFWCVEADYDKVPGVLETVSGYTGGTVANPSYKQVVAGGTGHYEAVRIAYDPSKVGYRELLDVFWRTVDPTDAGGQFCDRGDSYRTAVFVADDAERRIAEDSKRAAEQALGKTIVTPILPAGPFYVAEGYHQNYYRTSALNYRFYRWNCGRDQRVNALWGDEAYKGVPGH